MDAKPPKSPPLTVSSSSMLNLRWLFMVPLRCSGRAVIARHGDILAAAFKATVTEVTQELESNAGTRLSGAMYENRPH